jgi:hypothetical protein
MYAVSSAFLGRLARPHRPAVRVRVLDAHQFETADPVSIADLDLITGDVSMSAAGDIKATADLTVPGVWWAHVAPYGRELFIERGVEYDDGSTELVPLGYFRIDEAEQEDAPDGPVRLSCSDRTAQLRQSRVLVPWQIPDGTTHADVFEALVNGAGGHARPAFPGHTVPWDGDYNLHSYRVYGGYVVEDSILEALSDLAALADCTLTWTEQGVPYFKSRQIFDDTPSWLLRRGTGGNLTRVTRRVNREGVYNIVSAYGSNPAAPTTYQVATNTAGALAADGLFGPSLRFYASPVLRSDAQAAQAAATVLGRYAALPEAQALETVPNPALRPMDVLAVYLGTSAAPTSVLVDQLVCPLTGGPMRIEARAVGAPPSDPGQRAPAGSGTTPYQGGTIIEYDEDTGHNVIDIGGEEFTDLPMTGCCGGDIGDYVSIGWGDAGPMVLGPVAAFPSYDGLGIGGSVTTRNLIANPKLDNDDTGWTGGARAACSTTVQADHILGPTSLASIYTDAAWAYEVTINATPVTVRLPAFPVTPGRGYDVAVNGAKPAVSSPWSSYFEWLDETSTVIGTSALHAHGGTSGTFKVQGNSWEREVAPAGAVYARPCLDMLNVAGARTVQLTKAIARDMGPADSMLLPTPYWDGDTTPADFAGLQAGLVAFTCSWDGTPGSSTSTYVGPA